MGVESNLDFRGGCPESSRLKDSGAGNMGLWPSLTLEYRTRGLGDTALRKGTRTGNKRGIVRNLVDERSIRETRNPQVRVRKTGLYQGT